MVAEAPLRAVKVHLSASSLPLYLSARPNSSQQGSTELTSSNRMMSIIDISTRQFLDQLVRAEIDGMGRT